MIEFKMSDYVYVGFNIKNYYMMMKSCIFFNCYQIAGCCGTFTVDSRLDTCVQQLKKNVGNMNVLVSTTSKSKMKENINFVETSHRYVKLPLECLH